mgnify:CR=1 FL=1
MKQDFAEAYNNLGSAYNALGKSKKAIELYEKVFTLKPNYAEAHNNLGSALKDLRRSKEAAKCYEKAILINPDYAEAYCNLGSIYNDKKDRLNALKCYKKALKIKPDTDFLLGDILNAKMNMCQWENLQDLIDDLKARLEKNEKVISPFALLSLIDNPHLQRKASEIFASYYYPKDDSLGELDSYSKHPKIRVGYFSADFRIHPVATLTAELYELHDREQFEIHAFSFGPDTNDEMNLRIKEGVDHFHNVREMSHKDLAMFARSLEIDIAVDLGGYTADCRTEMFAMSSAPIQLCYIGVLATMGSDYYDYIIVGKDMIPEKNQKYYAEKIVYLPSYQVNDSTESPPEAVLTRNDFGLPEKGFVF